MQDINGKVKNQLQFVPLASYLFGQLKIEIGEKKLFHLSIEKS